MKWRPIKTAPIDRGALLVADDTGYVVEAWYDDEQRGWWEINTDHADYPGGDRRVYPTHWMPLPDPPRVK